MNRKNNALIPMENRESVTLHGKLHTVLMTLLENPYTAFFVETMPLCVQLNLIALLRLTIVNVFLYRDLGDCCNSVRFACYNTDLQHQRGHQITFFATDNVPENCCCHSAQQWFYHAYGTGFIGTEYPNKYHR